MKPKLGVLLVHGIGEQRRGQTLTRWGDALVHWLAGSDDVFGSYQRDYRARFSSVTASDAEIAPDGDSASPAHVELSLETNPGLWAHDAPREGWRDAAELRERWLLAEGFWADRSTLPALRLRSAGSSWCCLDPLEPLRQGGATEVVAPRNARVDGETTRVPVGHASGGDRVTARAAARYPPRAGPRSSRRTV